MRSVCTSPKKFSSKTFFRLEKRCKSEGERKKIFDKNVFGEEVHNQKCTWYYFKNIFIDSCSYFSLHKLYFPHKMF
jgi:hypothetical protein